jgi:hypothetical protein
MSDRQTEQERDAAVIDPAAMIREMASMMIVYPHYHDTYNRAIRTIDRLTAERNAVIERWGAMVDIVPDHLRGKEPAEAMQALIAERDAARAEVKRLRNAVWSAYSDLHAHLYVATNMEGGRLFSAYETLRANYTAIRAALGIESEAGE